MAKKMRKILTLLLAISMLMSYAATGASAWHAPESSSVNYEFIEIVCNGKQIYFESGGAGRDKWLADGTYSSSFSREGNIITWRFGSHSGQTEIPVPEGYTVSACEMSETTVNSSHKTYDNAILLVTVTAVTDPEGNEVPVDPSGNLYNSYKIEYFFSENGVDGDYVKNESLTQSGQANLGTTVNATTSFAGYEAKEGNPGGVTVGSVAEENYAALYFYKEEAEPVTYAEAYVFLSGTEGKELPQGVTSQKPADNSGLEALPQAPSRNEFEPVLDGAGTWTFEGFDQGVVSEDGLTVTFTGLWVWTAFTYEVEYIFISGTEGKELPQGVTEQKPANASGLAALPEAPAANFTAVEDGAGIWNFDSWFKYELTPDGLKATYTGRWTWQAYYEVNYVFVSGTEGMQLPQGVTEQKPADADKLLALPQAPAADFRAVAENDGNWTFVSWDEGVLSQDQRAITYTGVWVWTANVHEYYYKVAYEFYQDGVRVGEIPAGEPVSSELIRVSLEPETVMEFQRESYELNSDAAVYTNVDISSSIDDAEKAVLITLRYERNTPPQPQRYTVTVSYYNELTGELLDRHFAEYEAGSAYDHSADAKRSFEGLVFVRVEGPLTDDNIQADAYIDVYYSAPQPQEEPPVEEIPDEPVPKAEVPKTGDVTLQLLALSSLSGCALTGLLSKKRKEEE